MCLIIERDMDRIIPSNPRARWGGVRQKRSHWQFVLAENATLCEQKSLNVFFSGLIRAYRE